MNRSHAHLTVFRHCLWIGVCSAASLAAQNDPHAPGAAGGHEHQEPRIDQAAKRVPFERSGFRQDPQYGETWNAQEQLDIYGKKHPVVTQRPLLELGRELYREGPLQEGLDILGDNNRFYPQFLVYGDARVAAGTNRIGDERFQQLAPRLNLDLDLQLTATERIHAFISPLEQPKGDTTLTQAQWGDRDDDQFGLDGNVDALFFEGDLGAIWPRASGSDSNFDLPFSFGLMPLLFQNGVWVEDAFTGVAVTIPAKNSPGLGISNFDVTLFAGFDKVDTGAVAALGGDDEEATVFGANAFIEALSGYFEVGYGFTAGSVDVSPGSSVDIDYHNFTVAFSRRYGTWLSNSVRVIVNAGQDSDVDTATGSLFLLENSLITSNPYGFIPYLNLFAGLDRPQALARAAAAGGVLKNTGITFEGDALTAFPALDATGHEAIGGALGLNWLMDFAEADPWKRRQLVTEVAVFERYSDVEGFGAAADRVSGTSMAAGVRYQQPLTNALILRLDLTAGFLEEEDDYHGARIEMRWKF